MTEVAPITDEALARLEAHFTDSPSWASEQIPHLVAALREARRERDIDHAQLMAVSGAICDAGDVVVEPYADAVRELVRQRDEAKCLLAALRFTLRAQGSWADRQPIVAPDIEGRVAAILDSKLALLKRLYAMKDAP